MEKRSIKMPWACPMRVRSSAASLECVGLFDQLVGPRRRVAMVVAVGDGDAGAVAPGNKLGADGHRPLDGVLTVWLVL
jgi:hypothetical protein